MVNIEATDFIKRIDAAPFIKKMKEYPVGYWLLGLMYLLISLTSAVDIIGGSLGMYFALTAGKKLGGAIVLTSIITFRLLFIVETVLWFQRKIIAWRIAEGIQILFIVGCLFGMLFIFKTFQFGFHPITIISLAVLVFLLVLNIYIFDYIEKSDIRQLFNAKLLSNKLTTASLIIGLSLIILFSFYNPLENQQDFESEKVKINDQIALTKGSIENFQLVKSNGDSEGYLAGIAEFSYQLIGYTGNPKDYSLGVNYLSHYDDYNNVSFEKLDVISNPSGNLKVKVYFPAKYGASPKVLGLKRPVTAFIAIYQELDGRRSKIIASSKRFILANNYGQASSSDRLSTITARSAAVLGKGELKGTILTDNGKPVTNRFSKRVGANITVRPVKKRGNPYRGRSDSADGSFMLRRLEPGTYDVFIDESYWRDPSRGLKVKYRPQRIFNVVVKPKEETVLNITVHEGEGLEEIGKSDVSEVSME